MTKKIPTSATGLNRRTLLAGTASLLASPLVITSAQAQAKAVNIGVLPVTPVTDREISEACSAIIAMRRDLMRALGMAEGSRP